MIDGLLQLFQEFLTMSCGYLAPFFNSLYTVSEPVVWLSNDPVMMDALMRDRINAHRKQSGFENLDEDIRTLEFAETLGVGSTKTKLAKIIRVEE